MPDYEEMYHILFRETTKTILALQRAQQLAEEVYLYDATVEKPDENDNA